MAHRNSPQSACRFGGAAPTSSGHFLDRTVVARWVSRARNLAIENSELCKRGSEAPPSQAPMHTYIAKLTRVPRGEVIQGRRKMLKVCQCVKRVNAVLLC